MPEEGKRFPVRSVPHTGLGFMLAALWKELPGRSLPHINMCIQAVCLYFVRGCYEKKALATHTQILSIWLLREGLPFNLSQELHCADAKGLKCTVKASPTETYQHVKQNAVFKGVEET